MEDQSQEKVKIKLGGMTCASCALKIETRLKNLEGVSSSVVNFANEEATVEYNPGSTSYNEFNKAIKIKSDYVDAYNSRGKSYLKLEQYQLAIKNFNAAIKIRADYAEAFNNRGNAFFKIGQNQYAIKDFNEAISMTV